MTRLIIALSIALLPSLAFAKPNSAAKLSAKLAQASATLAKETPKKGITTATKHYNDAVARANAWFAKDVTKLH